MSGQSSFQVPKDELSFRASRASGAGGQHVNKTSSRVEVLWNVRESRALTDEQRERLLRKLGPRLSAEGILRVVASATRSQFRNRELAEQRLNDAVRSALAVPKKRRPTAPTQASREARLETKRLQSEKKRMRRVSPEE